MRLTDVLGDVKAFFGRQCAWLSGLGIEIAGCEVSHLAYRAVSDQQYLQMRANIEKHCCANVESSWNERPISKLLLAEPVDLGSGFSTSLIELIPPPHKNLSKTGLEHSAFVIGDAVTEFASQHRQALSGQPADDVVREPFYIRFADRSVAKFLRRSLFDMVVGDGLRFDGFYHVES